MTVAIILVNWNGWQDTIECLESVFRLDYPSFQVIVVDNSSSDGSIKHIKEWAAGQRYVATTGGPLDRFTIPPVSKPIDICEYNKAEAETACSTVDAARLVLINSGSNLGFAGGNNVGLRYMLGRPGFDFAWLLNNDTVVEPTALTAMVQRSRAAPSAGIVGSTLLFYRDPEMVQAYGGATFNRWTGRARPLGILTRRRNLDPETVAHIERSTAYVVGASMLVTISFLVDVGLMEESYFLYYEELDWARRGHPRYQVVYAPSSIVYHKVGKSAGTESLFSLHYFYRSRIRFMRKHYPACVPSAYLVMAWDGLKALIKGRRAEVTAIYRVIRHPASLPQVSPRPAAAVYQSK